MACRSCGEPGLLPLGQSTPHPCRQDLHCTPVWQFWLATDQVRPAGVQQNRRGGTAGATDLLHCRCRHPVPGYIVSARVSSQITRVPSRSLKDEGSISTLWLSLRVLIVISVHCCRTLFSSWNLWPQKPISKRPIWAVGPPPRTLCGLWGPNVYTCLPAAKESGTVALQRQKESAI